jgi:hypothetical protein
MKKEAETQTNIPRIEMSLVALKAAKKFLSWQRVSPRGLPMDEMEDRNSEELQRTIIEAIDECVANYKMEMSDWSDRLSDMVSLLMITCMDNKTWHEAQDLIQEYEASKRDTSNLNTVAANTASH